MGLQAFDETFYLTMKGSNKTIQDYWITERYLTDGSLSVSIFDGEQRVPSFFTFEKSNDLSRKGGFSFRYEGKEDSIKRTVFFVGDRDIVIVAGENNFKIILISTSVIVLSMMIANFIMNSLDFTTVFLCTFFLGSCLLQGTGGMAYATALVTAIAMTAIFCSLISFLNYRMAWKNTGPILSVLLIAFLCFTTGTAFHFWNLFFTIILCGIMIYYRIGTGQLDAENERMISKAYLSVLAFYVSAFWIITSSFFYYPSELWMRLSRPFKDLVRNELPDTLAISLYNPLIALAIISVAYSHLSILRNKINESEIALKEGLYTEATFHVKDDN